MPRTSSKKTKPKADAKDILEELTPEEQDEIDWEYDTGDMDLNEEANQLASNFVNPITGSNAPPRVSAVDVPSYLLPGFGPGLSSTPDGPPSSPMDDPVMRKDKCYREEMFIDITFDCNTELVQIADLMNKLKDRLDSVDFIRNVSIKTNTSYSKD